MKFEVRIARAVDDLCRALAAEELLNGGTVNRKNVIHGLIAGVIFTVEGILDGCDKELKKTIKSAIIEALKAGLFVDPELN